MKNIFDRLPAVPDAWKRKFESGDWMLIVLCAVIVGCLIIAFRVAGDDAASRDALIRTNKTLADSVQILQRRIAARDERIAARDRQIEFMTKELTGVIRIVDSLSAKYKAQKRKNENSVHNYRRLSTDQRIGEFANILSGKN